MVMCILFHGDMLSQNVQPTSQRRSNSTIFSTIISWLLNSFGVKFVDISFQIFIVVFVIIVFIVCLFQSHMCKFSIFSGYITWL